VETAQALSELAYLAIPAHTGMSGQRLSSQTTSVL
jgi:hypothetical protein